MPEAGERGGAKVKMQLGEREDLGAKLHVDVAVARSDGNRDGAMGRKIHN